MKNTIFSFLAMLFFTAVNAQTEPAKPQTPADTVKPVKVDVYNNITPATHVTADVYLPDHLKGVTSTTVQAKHYLPVLGTYGTDTTSGTLNATTTNTSVDNATTTSTDVTTTSTNATKIPTGTTLANNISITVDEQNVGIVWIEGLPQGRIKAIMKKAPATYKIPVQKTTEGKSVAEGTLIYDKDAKQLWIALGGTYNDENPSAPFTGKTKAKVWQLNRIETETLSTQPAIQQ